MTVQLGETTDPKALVPGEPERLLEDGAALRRKAVDFGTVGQGLDGVRVPSWTGEASDAFRVVFEPEPGKWRTVADAVGSAEKEIVGYADTLRWSQAQAAQAIDIYAEGQAATIKAAAAYQQLVNQTNAALAAGLPAPAPGPFPDPGQELRDRAQDMLDSARAQLAAAGDQASGAITGGLAASTGPGKSALDTIIDTVAGGWSGSGEVDVEALQAGGGASLLTGGKIAEFEAFATAVHATASATFENTALGVTGQASAEGYLGAKGHAAVGVTGLTLSGEAAARVAVAAELRRNFGPVASKLSLEAVAQARATAEAKVGVDGIVAKAGLEAVVSARGEISAEAYGVEVATGAEVHGGFALDGSVGVEWSNPREITLNFDGDIAFVGGVGIDGTITIDAVEVGQTAVEAADAVGGYVVDGSGKLVDIAKGAGGVLGDLAGETKDVLDEIPGVNRIPGLG